MRIAAHVPAGDKQDGRGAGQVVSVVEGREVFGCEIDIEAHVPRGGRAHRVDVALQGLPNPGVGDAEDRQKFLHRKAVQTRVCLQGSAAARIPLGTAGDLAPIDQLPGDTGEHTTGVMPAKFGLRLAQVPVFNHQVGARQFALPCQILGRADHRAGDIEVAVPSLGPTRERLDAWQRGLQAAMELEGGLGHEIDIAANLGPSCRCCWLVPSPDAGSAGDPRCLSSCPVGAS